MYPSFDNRLKSMLIDFVLNMFPLMPFLIISFIENSVLNSDYSSRFLIPVIFIFSILTKDIKDGRSIGKRLVGFQVVDSKTNQAATPTQCIIRNLTFLIWPIEALLLFGTPEYRIGDFLVRTKVVKHRISGPTEILEVQ